MAFLGYFTQFRIAVLARFSAIFIIELKCFELKLNQLNVF